MPQHCENVRVLDIASRWIQGLPSESTYSQLKALRGCLPSEVETIALSIPINHLEPATFCWSSSHAQGKICLTQIKSFLGRNPKTDLLIQTLVSKVESQFYIPVPPPLPHSPSTPPPLPPLPPTTSETPALSDAGVTQKLEKQKMLPDRELEFSLTKPFISFPSNTSVWYSATQVFGKLSDALGTQAEWDQDSLGRMGLGLFTLWYQWTLTYYSHEVAHNQTELNHGATTPGDVDFSTWGFHLAPEWRHPRNWVDQSRYEHQLGDVHGLNQQELNSTHQFRKNVQKGSFTFDEGVAYVFNNFADIAYHTLDFFGKETPDIDEFISNTIENESHVSRDTFALWSGLTALASYHTWESAKAYIDYLKTGDRTPQGIYHIPWGDAEVIPPHLELYPHPFGLFANGELPIRKWPALDTILFLKAGLGVAGSLEVSRFGAELAGIKLSPSKDWYIPTIDLFGSLNFNPPNTDALLSERPLIKAKKESEKVVKIVAEYEGSMNTTPVSHGFLGGLRLSFGEKNFQVGVNLFYSQNDMLENAIKGNASGWQGSLNAALTF